MIDVLPNADGVLHRKRSFIVQRVFEPGMTVSLLPARCGNQPVISLAQAIPEKSYCCGRRAGRSCSELAAAMKQIKELSACSAKKR